MTLRTEFALQPAVIAELRELARQYAETVAATLAAASPASAYLPVCDVPRTRDVTLSVRVRECVASRSRIDAKACMPAHAAACQPTLRASVPGMTEEIQRRDSAFTVGQTVTQTISRQ